MESWKAKAADMFFGSGSKIIDIAEEVGKSRQTVSTFLQSCGGYDAELRRRKEENAARRKYKKMIWARDSRTEAAVLRREHEQAVRELSAEKYH